MTPEPIDWTEEPLLDPEQERRALLRSLRRRQGFGVLFVRCTPNQVDRLVEQVQQELPQKKTALLTLTEPIDNLFEIVDRRPDKQDLRILLIQGLERSLEPYIQPGYGGEGDYYKLDTAPRILSHLNQQRENFRDHFPQLCFVFLLPRFAIKYVIRRAPDFFDWGSGIFEIPMDLERLQQESSQFKFKRLEEKDYSVLSPQEGREEILKIQALIEEPQQTEQTRADLYYEQALLYSTNGDCEAALTSYDRSLAIKPFNHLAWNNRGLALTKMSCYENAISSFNIALEVKPDSYFAWFNRGNALYNLENYEEAIASYDQALRCKLDSSETWLYRGNALDSLGHYEEAIASYDKALQYKSDDPEIWYYRGNTLGNLEKYEEAIAAYTQALQYKQSHY
ncbi:MAG TPA: tetratricopeptide repeat protein, partial [Thermosynechococcaceae cyanobacterium]